MEQSTTVEAIAEIIQLAVAPVFLLAGIAGFMNVLTTRLGRIVDRARVIERQIPMAKKEDQRNMLQVETNSLWRRIRLINWAIRLSVLGALMVCMVIVTLFIGDYIAFNMAGFIAFEFVSAMLLVISGLVLFLFEVGVSTRRMRQGMEVVFDEQRPDS